jgi:hypothetical protein
VSEVQNKHFIPNVYIPVHFSSSSVLRVSSSRVKIVLSWYSTVAYKILQLTLQKLPILELTGRTGIVRFSSYVGFQGLKEKS